MSLTTVCRPDTDDPVKSKHYCQNRTKAWYYTKEKKYTKKKICRNTGLSASTRSIISNIFVVMIKYNIHISGNPSGHTI